MDARPYQHQAEGPEHPLALSLTTHSTTAAVAVLTDAATAASATPATAAASAKRPWPGAGRPAWADGPSTRKDDFRAAPYADPPYGVTAAR
ncbi:hypothetical protein ACH429_18160 [Streptomyces pathocidini]|uniref:Uncharacterized protein n=1 Tax=Streptomyces pathocidini TaxID=1650571 RepID=A0ABW7UTR6_9ACTN|nr:hypothetical protein [Streptomyces pathocidini]